MLFFKSIRFLLFQLFQPLQLIDNYSNCMEQ
nr:MAG TPA: hypothetical protein [Caudoviricetes sp.]DAM32942.1 MAG TPA: hypothetical protein [Caudoviricetes sp.]